MANGAKQSISLFKIVFFGMEKCFTPIGGISVIIVVVKHILTIIILDGEHQVHCKECHYVYGVLYPGYTGGHKIRQPEKYDYYQYESYIIQSKIVFYTLLIYKRIYSCKILQRYYDFFVIVQKKALKLLF